MACAKDGTASFLRLFLLQRYYITASFLKTAMSFPASNTRIMCVCMASHSVALLGRVNNKPLALNGHMNNIENQCIIHLRTNHCYCINISIDTGLPTVLY